MNNETRVGKFVRNSIITVLTGDPNVILDTIHKRRSSGYRRQDNRRGRSERRRSTLRPRTYQKCHVLSGRVTRSSKTQQLVRNLILSIKFMDLCVPQICDFPAAWLSKIRN